MNTRVVCNWKPRELSREHLTRNFVRLVRKHGFKLEYSGKRPLGIDIRSPQYRYPRGDDVLSFHKDCGGGAIQFIVWSNIYPTEVKFNNGEMFQCRDGDVLLIDNREAKHRVPPQYKSGKTNRWFARAYIL